MDDNAWHEDFYRYHDCFHLGLYALTKHSLTLDYFYDPNKNAYQPVENPLMVTVKDSEGEIIKRYEAGSLENDRVEKREEILSLMSFHYAQKENFFQNQKPSKRCCRILKMLAEQTPWQKTNWRQILPPIYAVFEQLKQNRGGIVQVDQERQIF